MSPNTSAYYEEEDLSPLEYARANKLSRDYMADCCGILELEALRDTQAAELTNDLENYDLPIFSRVKLRTEERLTISKEAAILIKSVAKVDYANQISERIFSLLEDRNRVSKLKLEPPLLYSNNQLDLINFASREKPMAQILSIKASLGIDDMNSPHNSISLENPVCTSHELMEDIKRERLLVSKKTLAFLQNLWRFDWTEQDSENLWTSQQTYKRNTDTDPVTPPLSPRESSIQPYQPSSFDSIFQIPVLTDPISPTRKQLQEIECSIFKQDVPIEVRESMLLSEPETTGELHDTSMNDLYPSLVTLDDMKCLNYNSSPTLKCDNLKVEGMLTPEGLIHENVSRISLSDVIDNLKFSLDDEPNVSSFEEKFFNEFILPAYESTSLKMEQETLVEADTTCRVAVPIVDFSKEEPPWDIYHDSNTALASLQQSCTILREIFEQSLADWPAPTNFDHVLKWALFPRDIAIRVLEDDVYFHDESIFKDYLPSEIRVNIIDSSDAVWKPESLKICRNDEEDEKNEDEELELNYGIFQLVEVPREISTLVGKRKVETQENTFPIEENQVKTLGFFDKSQLNLQQSSRLGQKKNYPKETCNLLPIKFSAGDAVENYLQIRRNKKPKLYNSPYFDQQPPQSPIEHHKTLQEHKDHGSTTETTSVSLQAAQPVPPFCSNQAASIIVASNLFARRLLIQTIENLYPQVNLIERDFSVHKTITWVRGSVARSSVTSPLANEADFIVSPTTGIILTTLQKIKQKPLPGQKGRAFFHEHMISVCTRYEMLIILVSEGRADESSGGLAARDCLAFNEFIGLTASLETSMIVYFVGGGEKTLARWVVSCISRHYVNGLQLLQHETHWELFLRRAGLNSFAAQTVIISMKASRINIGDDQKNSSSYGLSEFVGLSAEKRMEKYGNLVGRQVMTRVNTFIDSSWDI
ncbi:BgTH12-00233 [Blumeria graminis f. sp. triticale]|uniref:Bgt-4857 n=3 Tax=Blumeria graminis TaxID=34373 RepID=A0A061HD72_BLUGR|nr:hypothetical protein BGT96224_4857 [Blumeria graminis f. sp. tritici 96224]CAD6504728.1 BgTH12-00233 [Blumeria graminis f. sp. triticale]VCU39484.1 Bgt-4857 [Blumeria graminis f. sp. tritici]